MLTYERLVGQVWRENGDGDVWSLHTIVNMLRRKLGEDSGNPADIFTEPRVRYWMPEGEG